VSWAMSSLFAEVFEFEDGRSSSSAAGPDASGRGGGAGSRSAVYFRRYRTAAPVRLLASIFTPLSSSGTARAGAGHGGGLNYKQESDAAADLEETVILGSDVLKLSQLSHHPQFPYREFERQWVLDHARVKGGYTALQLSPLAARETLGGAGAATTGSGGGGAAEGGARGGGGDALYSLPLVRCDIVNMTRHVHHHYDYAKDGHSRTYTMRIRANQTWGDLVMSHVGDPSRAQPHPTAAGILLSTADVHARGGAGGAGGAGGGAMYSMHGAAAAEAPEDGAAAEAFAGEMAASDANADADAEAGTGGGAEGAAAAEGLLLPLGFHPNQHSVVSVHLLRDRDGFPIPYTNIYGVTLITALRLGLETSLRDRLFKFFLAMPLFEDMAPWNVVLMGSVSRSQSYLYSLLLLYCFIFCILFLKLFYSIFVYLFILEFGLHRL
jgi:hypothetical protein